MPEINKTANLFNQSSARLPLAVWLSGLFTQPWCCFCLVFLQVLKSQAYLPSRDPSGPFLMAVDHCFSIKGQGTVMTGTILSGSVSLGDNVEIPALKVSLSFSLLLIFLIERDAQQRTVCSLPIWNYSAIFNVSFFWCSTISQLIIGRDIETFKQGIQYLLNFSWMKRRLT